MDEPTRLKFQAHVLGICRQRGWIDAENRPLWSVEVKERALQARGQFGLELISGTDSVFAEAREKLGATHLAMPPEGDTRLQVLRGMTDTQKQAVLALVDEALDFCTYQFMIGFDRCEFGRLLIKHQETDEDGQPDPTSEVLVNPSDSFLEMFQEAYGWKEEFGMGAEIGRRARSG
jgi:hypothetical protein